MLTFKTTFCLAGQCKDHSVLSRPGWVLGGQGPQIGGVKNAGREVGAHTARRVREPLL